MPTFFTTNNAPLSGVLPATNTKVILCLGGDLPSELWQMLHDRQAPVQIILLVDDEAKFKTLFAKKNLLLVPILAKACPKVQVQRLQLTQYLWLDIYIGNITQRLEQLPAGSVDLLLGGSKPVSDSHYQRLLRLLHQDSQVVNLLPLVTLPEASPHWPPSPLRKSQTMTVIGAGVAGASLALSLVRRGHNVRLFCADETAGMAASGNRQGAIYPLLTPENDVLSRLFVPASLYARHFVEALAHHDIPFAFCGVLHTAHDQRSSDRMDKLLSRDWPGAIARPVTASEASTIAGVEIDKRGIFYANGGWVSPAKLCQAAVAEAKTLGLDCHFSVDIVKITATPDGWQLYDSDNQLVDTAKTVILASGHRVTAFNETSALQLAPFRGQVSHVPSRGKLLQLTTVLCADGYMTPGFAGSHCLGASYVREDTDLEFRQSEHQDNLEKIRQSYPNNPWTADIDISDQSARVGVRMVSRDHLPMAGAVPDVAAIKRLHGIRGNGPRAAHLWQQETVPTHQGLYVFTGLGSRGLSSGPLVADCFADLLSGSVPVLDSDVMDALNPNRMWLRKLRKGKSLD